MIDVKRWSNEIFGVIARQIEDGGFRLPDLFRQLDTNNDNTLDAEEFKRLFRGINTLRLSEADLRKLWRIADKNSENGILYSRFIEIFEGHKTRIIDEDANFAKLDQIQQKMESKRLSMTQVFNSAGMIDAQQFRKGVMLLELDMSSIELDRLFRYLSKGQNLMEMRALQEGLNQAASVKFREQDNRIFEAVSQQIAASRQNLRDLFLRLDTNGNGRLSENEFVQLFRSIQGNRFTGSDLRRLWNIA